MKYLLLLLLVTTGAIPLFAQTEIPLYKDIPNAIAGPNEESSATGSRGITRIKDISIPTLTIFLPPKEKATGAAMVICPGGGYGIVAIDHEGYDVAKRLNEMGIAAFVLKYRLPSDKIMPDKSIGPVQDAQRAIELVRANAKEYGIDKNRVGIMGFSAGGHLASTAGTHYKTHYTGAKKKVNLRPDFMVLVYPVISFADSITHRGSRDNLLGPGAAMEKVLDFSNELHVDKKTPPTFLVHAQDDSAVKVHNTLYFASRLQKNKVPFDFYLYDEGGHGFGLNNPTSDVQWIDLVEAWMRKSGWLDKK